MAKHTDAGQAAPPGEPKTVAAGSPSPHVLVERRRQCSSSSVRQTEPRPSARGRASGEGTRGARGRGKVEGATAQPLPPPKHPSLPFSCPRSSSLASLPRSPPPWTIPSSLLAPASTHSDAALSRPPCPQRSPDCFRQAVRGAAPRHLGPSQEGQGLPAGGACRTFHAGRSRLRMWEHGKKVRRGGDVASRGKVRGLARSHPSTPVLLFLAWAAAAGLTAGLVEWRFCVRVSTFCAATVLLPSEGAARSHARWPFSDVVRLVRGGLT